MPCRSQDIIVNGKGGSHDSSGLVTTDHVDA
jgi:hypothetical protein